MWKALVLATLICNPANEKRLGVIRMQSIRGVGLYPDHEPVGSSLARSRDPLHIAATLKKKIRS